MYHKIYFSFFFYSFYRPLRKTQIKDDKIPALYIIYREVKNNTNNFFLLKNKTKSGVYKCTHVSM